MPETHKPPFTTDLAADTAITAAFLVLRKEVKAKKDGSPYLALTLGDRTGSLEANCWDNVEAIAPTFERDDFVKVRARCSTYRDKLQLTIEKLRRLDESEVTLADYLPITRADITAMWGELEGRVAAFKNPHLRQLLQAIFGDHAIAVAFRRAPAAKVLHHAYLGGLLEHVTSLCRLADRVTPNYAFVDAELVLTGVLLHDLGKIEELNYQRSFSYSTPGQLLGHMVQVLEILHRKLAALPDFPRPLQTVIEHLIVSHHGKYEFGSPKLPMFPEAMLLHQLDDMDSKMEAMRFQLENEPASEGAPEWTAYNRSLERPLLRLHRYLDGLDAASERARPAGAFGGPQPGGREAVRSAQPSEAPRQAVTEAASS